MSELLWKSLGQCVPKMMTRFPSHSSLYISIYNGISSESVLYRPILSAGHHPLPQLYMHNLIDTWQPVICMYICTYCVCVVYPYHKFVHTYLEECWLPILNLSTGRPTQRFLDQFHSPHFLARSAVRWCTFLLVLSTFMEQQTWQSLHGHVFQVIKSSLFLCIMYSCMYEVYVCISLRLRHTHLCTYVCTHTYCATRKLYLQLSHEQVCTCMCTCE